MPTAMSCARPWFYGLWIWCCGEGCAETVKNSDRLFSRCPRLYGKRVYAIYQHILQHRVDLALAFQSRAAAKGVCAYLHREVAFAAAIMTGVAHMAITVIVHLQMTGCERLLQALCNLSGDGAHFSLPTLHGVDYSPFHEADEEARAVSGRSAGFGGRVAQEEVHPCAAPDCPHGGEFRAPLSNRGRQAGEGWQWLCLAHVRAFNASYNYFDGLDPDEIYRQSRPSAGWERFTRPFAPHMADIHGVMGDRFGTKVHPETEKPLKKQDIEAYQHLGLAVGASKEEIRAAYRDKVRRYHPDSHGGDRRHEAKLQRVIEAYTHLKTLLDL